MTSTRRLIVNADDFGQSAGINRGVAEAHENGVVTSASLMVCWPDAPAAVASAKRWKGFSIGLHIDLGEWTYRDGTWRPYYERVPIRDAGAVAAEIDAQLNAFRALVGRDPTHLDSHQHVHLREPVRQLLLERTDRLGVPIRDVRGDVLYRGTFYGLQREGKPQPDAPHQLPALARASRRRAALPAVGACRRVLLRRLGRLPRRLSFRRPPRRSVLRPDAPLRLERQQPDRDAAAAPVGGSVRDQF